MAVNLSWLSWWASWPAGTIYNVPISSPVVWKTQLLKVDRINLAWADQLLVSNWTWVLMAIYVLWVYLASLSSIRVLLIHNNANIYKSIFIKAFEKGRGWNASCFYIFLCRCKIMFKFFIIYIHKVVVYVYMAVCHSLLLLSQAF